MIRFASLAFCAMLPLTTAADEDPVVFRDASGMWFICSKTASTCGYGRSRAEAVAHLRQISATKPAMHPDPNIEKADRFLRDRKIDSKLEELESRITIIENNKR